MGSSVVIMGVSGCGKSSLGAAFAQANHLPLIEGDDHHSEQSRAKMSQGVALTDEDRDGWLTLLGEHLRSAPSGAVLTCSALKKRYRDQLRAASPGLCFVYLDLSREVAQARVASRSSHFFSPSLVDSQFAALEPPTDEPGVLNVDATQSLSDLLSLVNGWYAQEAVVKTDSPPETRPS